MRCPKCNVDLGEEYRHCPLCGEETQSAPTQFDGFKTAEYPDIKYRPYKHNYPRLYFIIYICLSAFVTGAEWIARSGDSVKIAPWVLLLGPVVWAVLLRPFLVKRYYFGSHVYRTVFFSTPLVLWMCRENSGSFNSAFEFWLPLLVACAAFLILCGLFAVPKRRKTAVLYIIGLAFLALVLTIICAALKLSVLVPLIAAAVCLVTFGTDLVLEPEKTADELAARFSL